MLNTTNNNSKTVLNTPATGIMQKSNDKSYFLRMHYNSKLADRLLSKNPTYSSKKIIVLQILLIHEEWIMLEIIDESDFLLV